MKELHFEYKMRLEFSSFVEKHRFTLKCIPRSNERQEIENLEIMVYPKEFLSNAEDSFGNRCIYGHAEGKHDHFSFKISGTARTGLAPSETAKESHLIGIYKYQTEYTRPGPCIQAFARQFSFGPNTTAYEKAEAYMHGLYGTFQYVQHVTDIYTTAEQAMALGKGVCLLCLTRLSKFLRCFYAAPPGGTSNPLAQLPRRAATAGPPLAFQRAKSLINTWDTAPINFN